MNYSLILLCAGSGKRTGLKYNKIFYKINNQTVYEMNISHFLEDNRCKQIIVVTKENEIDDIRTLVNDSRIEYVFGGKERQDSVYEGLQKVTEDYVFIHDGARPFIDEGIIERAYECVCKSDACIAGMPVKDTIKIVNERQRVESTPDRATLWAIQTPQVFLADLLLKAYGKLMKQNWIQVTDDAMVVEKMLNHEVQVFTGKYENIKITTPEDLVIAEAFLGK